ncbi:tyrosine-type recombinase/integrase [Methanosarcina mazei]|uniref:Site-specific integrase n=1 Tax=Methanosarcina mazei TaxID=2209 RepID=A0A6C0VHR4_METMZ|nr:tyrosine-type recombinase/integrase [Methanosarcina mazei]QIB91007.1 site-specific integrase [Methanosarcina mazei]
MVSSNYKTKTSTKITHEHVTEAVKYPTQGLKRDRETLHLYTKGEIKILTPEEYQKLRAAIPKDEYKTILDVLIVTGMRYIEVCRLYDNREWYNDKRNIIHLPPEAQKKHKRTQIERTIQPLPSMWNYTMTSFFNGKKPPVESSWNRNLQRWARLAGMNPYGISAKTTRKTIESWMISSGILESTTCLRQGHDSLTSMRHYQNLAFSDNEQNDIKKQLTAWGILR